MMPFIRLETEARYVRGLPAFAAVTVENREADWEFGGLPVSDLLDSGSAVEIRLNGVTLIPASPVRRLRLRPGESMRMLVDLGPLPAGRWEVQAVYARGAISEPVQIEVVEGAGVQGEAGIAEPEAAALRLEMLAGDPSFESECERLLARWPALRWRVDDIRRGEGVLALRREVERS